MKKMCQVCNHDEMFVFGVVIACSSTSITACQLLEPISRILMMRTSHTVCIAPSCKLGKKSMQFVICDRLSVPQWHLYD